MNVMGARWARLYRQTAAERSLEPAVAALGRPYRVQEPLYLGLHGPALRYFPDFLIPSLNLVVEVDDPSHKEKATEDAVRTWWLWKVYGWRVVRVTNEEALTRPALALREALERAAGQAPPREPPRPTGIPESGRQGEGSDPGSTARKSPRKRAGKESVRGRAPRASSGPRQ